MTKCSECEANTCASVSDPRPLCEQCQKKLGFKKWEEMTPEEKVEALNTRISHMESRLASMEFSRGLVGR